MAEQSETPIKLRDVIQLAKAAGLVAVAMFLVFVAFPAGVELLSAVIG